MATHTGTFRIDAATARSIFGTDCNIEFVTACLTTGDGQCGIHALLGDLGTVWKPFGFFSYVETAYHFCHVRYSPNRCEI